MDVDHGKTSEDPLDDPIAERPAKPLVPTPVPEGSGMFRNILVLSMLVAMLVIGVVLYQSQSTLDQLVSAGSPKIVTDQDGKVISANLSGIKNVGDSDLSVIPKHDRLSKLSRV